MSFEIGDTVYFYKYSKIMSGEIRELFIKNFCTEAHMIYSKDGLRHAIDVYEVFNSKEECKKYNIEGLKMELYKYKGKIAEILEEMKELEKM